MLIEPFERLVVLLEVLALELFPEAEGIIMGVEYLDISFCIVDFIFGNNGTFNGIKFN